jgi:hypothetical protein
MPRGNDAGTGIAQNSQLLTIQGRSLVHELQM